MPSIRQFIPLHEAPEVYISHPRDHVSPHRPDDPTVVVILAWMDASIHHLQKFTDSYDQLYPAATQIVLTISQSFYWKTPESADLSLLPAIPILSQFGLGRKRLASDRIFFHVLSNGGCVKLLTLHNAIALYDPSLSSTPLPASAIIFDSCPGTSDPPHLIRGFTASIRNPFTRSAAAAAFRVFLFFLLTWNSWSGGVTSDMAQVVHARLLSPTVLPPDILKTFIYSKMDTIIPYKAVENQAEEARKRGALVDLNPFEQGDHLKHLKLDPQRYWHIVQRTWQTTARELRRPEALLYRPRYLGVGEQEMARL